MRIVTTSIWVWALAWSTAFAQAPFYTEDFSESVFPSGWSTADISGNPSSLKVQWNRCANPSTCAPANQGYFLNYFETTFRSSTAENGYMVANSANVNLGTNGPHISILTSEPIDCSLYETVYLEFETHIGFLDYLPHDHAILQISTDSSSWDTYKIFPEVPPIEFPDNGFFQNPVKILVDISATASLSSTVYLRWQWTGKEEWNWSLDDVALYEQSPYSEQVVWGNLSGQGDFAGGMNGWTVNTPEEGWMWDPYGFIGNAFSAPESFYIASPSACNGAMVMNADFYTTGNQFPPPGNLPIYTTILTSPTIDLSTTAEKLSLRFFQAYHLGNKLNAFPSVTNLSFSADDGQNWSPWVSANPNLGITDAWQQGFRTIPLPDDLIGQEAVKIRFQFAGRLFGWAVDDIQIYRRERHNLEVKRNFFAATPNLMTPADQTEPWHFLIDVQNVGRDTQTNATLRVQVVDQSSQEQVFQDSVAFAVIPPDSLFENIQFPNSYQAPPNPQTYRVTYSIEADSLDEFPENDTLGFTFRITDSLFAKELGHTGAFAPGGSNAENYAYGNCYYLPPVDQPTDESTYACRVTFGIGNATDLGGQELLINLYQWEGDLNGDLVANQNEYNLISFNTYTVFGEESFQYITIPVQQGGAPVLLQPDFYYFVVIKYQSTNNQPFFIMASEAIDFQATYILYQELGKPRYTTMLELEDSGEYSIFGLGQESGFGQVPVARLHTCKVSNTQDLPPPKAIRLFPNPAQGVIQWEVPTTWPSNQAYQYQIVDSQGIIQLQGRVENDTSPVLSIQSLPNGAYWLHLLRGQERWVQNFQVQR